MSRPMIYVAGPYRAATADGVKRNIEAAINQARRLTAMGFCPVVPHLAVHFDPGCSDDFWIEFGLELLRRCDCVACLHPYYHDSEGTVAEIMEAIHTDKPVLFTAQEAQLYIDGFHAGSGLEPPEFDGDPTEEAELTLEYKLDESDLVFLDVPPIPGDN